MSREELSRLLRWYPADWRTRYGDELVVFMEDNYGDRRPPLRDRLSLVAGGLRERARRTGLAGDSVPPGERIRAGSLLVMAAWAVFVIAGSSFAKLSEHFDNWLPGGFDNPAPPGTSHHLPDLAYTALQQLAACAGIIALVGVALALPAFVRFLRAGGWTSLRAHTVRASAATGVAIGLTVALAIWAHHLTSHQRNGGMPQYSALFLIWGASIATGLGLWTAVAVAAGRRVELPGRLLVAEAGLAVALTLAMLGMIGATALWWASMATSAPAFFASAPGSAPVNPQLALTVAAMLVAVAVATSGSIRVARSYLLLRRA